MLPKRPSWRRARVREGAEEGVRREKKTINLVVRGLLRFNIRQNAFGCGLESVHISSSVGALDHSVPYNPPPPIPPSAVPASITVKDKMTHPLCSLGAHLCSQKIDSIKINTGLKVQLNKLILQISTDPVLYKSAEFSLQSEI